MDNSRRLVRTLAISSAFAFFLSVSLGSFLIYAVAHERREKRRAIHRVYRNRKLSKDEQTRRALDIMVGGMDDLEAAKYLLSSELTHRELRAHASVYADHALRRDPNSFDALYVKYRAVAYREPRGDAMPIARRLVELRPDCCETVSLFARRAWYQHPEEVIATINRYLLTNKGKREHYRNLGRAYERLDRIEEALHAYRKAYDMDRFRRSVNRLVSPVWERVERFMPVIVCGVRTPVHYKVIASGSRNYPSIWPERGLPSPNPKAPPYPFAHLLEASRVSDAKPSPDNEPDPETGRS